MRAGLGLAASLPAMALLVAFATAAPARGAEFDEGVRAYEKKDFAAARAVFLDLAGLGEGRSQYNLGVMALRGEGVPKDRGEAVGWMRAARENGQDPAPRALDDLVAGLTPPERESADRVVQRFGRSAMEASVLPTWEGSRPPAGIEPPRLVEGGRIHYPAQALEADIQAVVILRVIMGADGRPRDPQVVISLPSVPPRPLGRARTYVPSSRELARSFAREALRGVLERRYEPARRDGVPIPVIFDFKISFRLPEASGVVGETTGQGLLAAAGEGDSRARFAVGVLGREVRSRDEVRTGERPWGWVLSAAQAGVPEAQLMIGSTLVRNGSRERALPWLERAARAGLPSAQVAYGLALLSGPGPSHADVRELLVRASASDEPYAVRHAIAILACSREPALRDPKAAVEIASRARVDRDVDPLTLEALAAAHASAGDAAAAVRAERAAVERARKLGWSVAEMEARLAAYERGEACGGDFLPGDAVELPIGAGS